LSVVCYWVLPFVALGLATLVTSKYPDWFVEAANGDDVSRGSEGLLAAASRIDDLPLRSIVAVSPSSATWVGLGENGSLVGIPAWTLGGVDLPAVQTDDQAVLSDVARQAIRRRGRRIASVRLCCTYLGGTLRSSTMPK